MQNKILRMLELKMEENKTKERRLQDNSRRSKERERIGLNKKGKVEIWEERKEGHEREASDIY